MARHPNGDCEAEKRFILRNLFGKSADIGTRHSRGNTAELRDGGALTEREALFAMLCVAVTTVCCATRQNKIELRESRRFF
jgi:hypothetical protein